MPSAISEGNYAFMPTSNDSLYAHNFHGNGNHNAMANGHGNRDRAPSPTSHPPFGSFDWNRERTNNFIFDDSLTLSPQTEGSEYSIPSREDDDNGTTTPTPETMAAWNQARAQSGSPFGNTAQPKTPSSEIPKEVLFMNNAPEGACRHWYDQFMSARQAHQQEAEVWKQEKAIYEAQISYWRDAYHQAARRADSGVSGISAASKENDKIFHDPETVRAAQEGLRKVSVTGSIGPTSLASSRQQSLTEDATRKQSSVSAQSQGLTSTGAVRLSSINELPSPHSRKQSLGLDGEGREALGETGEIPIMHISDLEAEVPYSPPTTAVALSPPPENYRMHAGHTPRAIRSDRSSVTENLDEADNSASRATVGGSPLDGQDDQDETNSQAVFSADSADYELRSPKFLPTNPEDDKDVGTLVDLNDRLEGIAQNPKENPPEALRHMSSNTSSTVSDPNEHGPASGYDKGDAHDPTGGVMLKTKRSMNFGAPLGSTR